MRASQRVWSGVVNAFANCVAGYKLGVGTVFRLDRRSLRSGQLGLIAAATRAKTLAWMSVTDDQAGGVVKVTAVKQAEGRGVRLSKCFSSGLLSS